jgi:hypothetical protein
MKAPVFLIILLIFSIYAIAQKTLLVEKIGKSSKYYYHIGDNIKLKMFSNKNIMKGEITGLRDSSMTISSIKSDEVRLKEIQCVFKQFEFPRKFAIKSGEFGVVIFLVMVTNNLINNALVFTPYVFIVSGSFLGGSLISLMLSERRCKIGDQWKVKILNGNLK